jgi:hypothetical protein
MRRCDVVTLPEARWLPLREVAAFVSRRCECGTAEARAALHQAFREGAITANGLVPDWTGGDADLAWARSRGKSRPADLQPADWYMPVEWDRDRVERFREVRVERSILERWLDPPLAESGDTSADAADEPRASTTTAKSVRPGPKEGSGLYVAGDRKLFPDIAALIEGGMSLHGAVTEIADRITGAGTQESLINRVERRYRNEKEYQGR